MAERHIEVCNYFFCDFCSAEKSSELEVSNRDCEKEQKKPKKGFDKAEFRQRNRGQKDRNIDPAVGGSDSIKVVSTIPAPSRIPV